MAASIGCRAPVVVILGATGSGKSKLALEIGKVFKSEIISADSMQIYKGLDIVTNKVTKEELQQCPHHMMDYLSPLQERHTIVEYKNRALPIIDNLLQRKILPIIVGGTNYYIEALLYNFLITQKDLEIAKRRKGVPHPEMPRKVSKLSGEIPPQKAEQIERKETSEAYYDLCSHRNKKDTSSIGVTEKRENEHDQSFGLDMAEGLVWGEFEEEDMDPPLVKDSEFRQNQYGHLDNETLYKRLEEVDPTHAAKMHINDRRKLIRALEVYDKHGIPISELYKVQKENEESKRGPLRYKDICVFWVQCEMSVLRERINKRVDEMIERGLIQELLDFHQVYNTSRIRENEDIDYTHGIFQSIGFKEFHDYLILSEEERNSELGQKMLQEGIEKMKSVTRFYARKQINHIKNMFLKRQDTEVPPVYAVDSTDVSKWKENVHDRAIKILTDIVEGHTPEHNPIPKEESKVKFAMNYCEVCEKQFVIQHEYEAHIKGRHHYRRKKRMQRLKQEALKETVSILKTSVTQGKMFEQPDGSSDGMEASQSISKIMCQSDNEDSNVGPEFSSVMSKKDHEVVKCDNLEISDNNKLTKYGAADIPSGSAVVKCDDVLKFDSEEPLNISTKT